MDRYVRGDAHQVETARLCSFIYTFSELTRPSQVGD
jgi:hypothetical protein